MSQGFKLFPAPAESLVDGDCDGICQIEAAREVPRHRNRVKLFRIGVMDMLRESGAFTAVICNLLCES